MTILTGWREQYDRMLRSHKRLISLASGSSASSDEAKDALFHFFQDAFHLRDWLYHDTDPGLRSKVAQDELKYSAHSIIKTNPILQLCADLCNGTKHLQLDRAETGDMATGFATQSVRVQPPTLTLAASIPGATAQPANPAAQQQAVGFHHWSVESNQQTWDAVHLALRVVQTWDAWLKWKGLL
ncbi:hypothetical protein ACFSKW_54920 [Nonomuraea mangrovi]|uniref:Uncharacterized protein n=1 Tax=Nonomuraea mangrovi TaxID=2316207 RepID=A0ABW4TFA5_9ACTN